MMLFLKLHPALRLSVIENTLGILHINSVSHTRSSPCWHDNEKIRHYTSWDKQFAGTEQAYEHHQENILHAQRIGIWEAINSVLRNYYMQILACIGQIADSVSLYNWWSAAMFCSCHGWFIKENPKVLLKRSEWHPGCHRPLSPGDMWKIRQTATNVLKVRSTMCHKWCINAMPQNRNKVLLFPGKLAHYVPKQWHWYFYINALVLHMNVILMKALYFMYSTEEEFTSIAFVN